VLRFDHSNDLPCALYLPTYAATAWYHKRLAADLQARPLRALLDEVESFAGGEYLQALFKGAALTAAERTSVAKKLARFTGLDRGYIERSKLRIEIMRFCKELLRESGKTVGRLDSRYTGFDRDGAGEKFDFDPSHANINGAFAATINDYLRGDLKFEADIPYEILKGFYLNWGWGEEFSNRYAAVGETLRKAMSMNTHMKVLVANGYYDFATPHFAADYTFDHLGLDESLKPRLSFHYYEAGHMMYVHRPSLSALAGELKRFVAPA
jgi:carboxypeptidase C (cathepsin A)